MTRRRAAAAAAFAAAIVGAALIAVVATGESARPGAGLTWSEGPRVLRHDTIETDRVLTAAVRNDGDDQVRVRASDVVVRAGDGRPLESTTTFLRSFTHAIYPPGIEPSEVPDSELIRSGRLLDLEPGDSSPVTVAWRERRGGAPAARVEFAGAASLAVAQGSARTP